jgi:hypothetical protein
LRASPAAMPATEPEVEKMNKVYGAPFETEAEPPTA